MIYLSSVYSNSDPSVREERFRIACRVTAALLRAGQLIVSPIAHSHVLVEHGLPSDWSFWERFDRTLLERCDELLVLTLPGWQESVGVQAEIQIARELNIPIRYLDPDAILHNPRVTATSGCNETYQVVKEPTGNSIADQSWQ
jgi:hypothetical protein